MSLHNPVTQVVLPLFVVAVMFALGTTLTADDLARVLRRPRGFFVGVLTHALLLPAVAFLLALALQLPRNLAVGLVLIAACPAAAPANLFTHLARGDTMLCVCLTAAASVTSVFTLPVFVNGALRAFAPEHQAVQLPVLRTSLSLFVVSTLPVIVGMLLRRRRPAAARAVAARVGTLVLAAIPVLVAAVVWTEKDNVVTALADAGAAALLLNVVTLSLAWGAGALAGLERPQRIAVGLESSLQNFAMAAFVALTLLSDARLLLPPLAYALISFLPAGVVVWIGRNVTPASGRPSEALPRSGP